MCNAHPSLYPPQKCERGGLNAFTMSPTRWVELTNAKDIYFINNQNIYYHKKCTGQLCGRPPGNGSFEAAAENSPTQIGQSFVRLRTVYMQR